MERSTTENPAPDVVLVHSSDLHVDEDHLATPHCDGTRGLRSVLTAARALGADIVLLAGDTFENNHLGAAMIDRVGALLADAGASIVILPGNHDPALPDSVFVRGRFDLIPNVSILGVTHEEAVCFPAYDLEIWGQAHRGLLRYGAAARGAAAFDAVAGGDRARALRAARDAGQSAAPVLGFR